MTWLLLALVDLAAFAPRMAFPNHAPGSPMDRPWTRPMVPGIGYELGLLVALIALTAGARRRRAIHVGAVALFAAFLLFSTYHEAYLHNFYRDPAVVDDWHLLVKLGHFVRESSPGWKLGVILGIAAYLAAVALAAYAFARLQRWAESVSLRARAVGAALFTALGALALVVFRLPPANAVVQPLGDSIVLNWQASRVALANRHAIFDFPPDRGYDDYLTLPMPRRPNVYLMYVEAYGEILATCDSRPAYQELLRRIQGSLTAAGFQMRSGYSAAPVRGGRSWLSMATAQTGIRVDAEPAFNVVLDSAPQLPTLTRFFQTHGYRTLMLEPEDTPKFGLPLEDTYRRDVTVVRNDIPYHGGRWGMAGIPDQFSLQFFDETYLRHGPEPRFVFYMATSTHYDWNGVPPLMRDWRKMGELPLDWSNEVPWPPLTERQAVARGAPLFAAYFADIEYEWRALAQFIEQRRTEDALVVVVGDHQPLLLCHGEPTSDRTPIHILSRDAALVDRFADIGLTPGLWAEPGRAQLKHEAIYSLLASRLAPGATYHPDGLALSGLRR